MSTHPTNTHGVWTKENLQKLLARMRSSIPKRDRMTAYPKILKEVQWKKVAFPPCSPEACKEKWGEILIKMRKQRSITELITEAKKVISDPSRNPKIHPEHPKKPSPPSVIFYEENLAKRKELHPDLNGREMYWALSSEYNRLPDEEKAPYVEKSHLAQKEYKKKMMQFRKRYQTTVPLKRTANVSETSDEDEEHIEDTDGLPPKPPCHGYAVFCKEQKANMAGVPNNMYMTVWAKRWSELTKEQKSEYDARCKEFKRQYDAKLDAFFKTTEETQEQILTKHGINSTEMFPDEPMMPPRSGFDMFFKTYMSPLKETVPNQKDRMTRVSQLWHRLSAKEKEKYNAKASVSLRKYPVELQNWFKELPPAKRKQYLKSRPNKYKLLGDLAEEVFGYRPSDSEDEEMESSSSDDDDERVYCNFNSDQDEGEEEEHLDDIFFEIF